jgi:hypothetical protein
MFGLYNYHNQGAPGAAHGIVREAVLWPYVLKTIEAANAAGYIAA